MQQSMKQRMICTNITISMPTISSSLPLRSVSLIQTAKNTEVVLVEATDSDAASRVETALTNRYNSIFQQNASYSAEELDMVKNCKVTKDGNFVTMIIGEKASDMLTMFNDSIK